MKNPLQNWLDKLIYGCVFSFAGISATAVAAGVSAAATAATAASSLMAGDEQSAGAAQANAANAQLTAEQMRLADQARKSANAYQTPYYSTGTAGQNKLAYLMGITNEFDIPTDTSYNAYAASKNSTKAQIQLQLQQLKKLPKNPKARKQALAQRNKLQQQLTTINGILNKGQDSQQFQAWQSKQAGTQKVTAPINDQYGSLLRDNPEQFKFEADPGYQFRKDQGERDLNTQMASMGLTNSGAALKSGMEFNQGLANQEYQNAWSRYLDRNNIYNTNRDTKLNALSGFAATGQHAADNLSNNENTYGQSVTGAKANQNAIAQGNITGAANARSAGLVGAGNALAQGANSYLAYSSSQPNKSTTPKVMTAQSTMMGTNDPAYVQPVQQKARRKPNPFANIRRA
jgi:hypothetical protein